MSSEPKVVVVVVNYNGKRHLPDCLRSVLATDYSNFEVVLVDCASHDGSVEFMRATFPEVDIIDSKENRGLGAGNNLGVEHALRRSAD